MDTVVEMDDSILNDRFQFFLVYSECRLHFIQREHEIRAADLDRIDIVRDPRLRSDLHNERKSAQQFVSNLVIRYVGKEENIAHLDVSPKRKRRSALDQTAQLSSREILRLPRQFPHIHIPP